MERARLEAKGWDVLQEAVVRYLEVESELKSSDKTEHGALTAPGRGRAPDCCR